MDDLISREAAIAIMQAKGEMAMGTPANVFYCAAHMLEMMPAVDAEPVRHGRWVKASGMLPPECHDKKRCSVCANFALHDRVGRVRPSNYCPNCGAKMEEEQE